MIREMTMDEALEVMGGWSCSDTVNTFSSIVGGVVAGLSGVATTAATKNPYVGYSVGGAAGGATYDILNGVLNQLC